MFKPLFCSVVALCLFACGAPEPEPEPVEQECRECDDLVPARQHLPLCAPSECASGSDAGTVAPPGMALTSRTRCKAGVTLDGATPTEPLFLTHNVHRFSDGGVLATCSVSKGGFDATNILMHRPGQLGAIQGECIVIRDLDANSNGYWRFTVTQDGTASMGFYFDTGSPNHGREWLFPCVVD